MASIVVTLLSPTSARDVWHERTGWPSKCTVHAPQSACPQPNFVPLRPRRSRIAQSRGMSGSTPSKTRSCPFTVNFIAAFLGSELPGARQCDLSHPSLTCLPRFGTKQQSSRARFQKQRGCGGRLENEVRRLLRTREHSDMACCDLDGFGLDIFRHGSFQAWLDGAVRSCDEIPARFGFPRRHRNVFTKNGCSRCRLRRKQ